MSLWADPGASSRFDPFRKGAAHLDAVERVKDWTREHFGLGIDETVVVNEGPASFPGCPPVETLVAFWSADGTPHHFKVFKSVAEVDEGDIPPAWMREALSGMPGLTCSCC